MVKTSDGPQSEIDGAEPVPEPRRDLSEAAKRALAEAEERRKARDTAESANGAKPEVGGRSGPDPVRYGDWEKDGIVSDF